MRLCQQAVRASCSSVDHSETALTVLDCFGSTFYFSLRAHVLGLWALDGAVTESDK